MRCVSPPLLCALLLAACAVPGPGADPRSGSALDGSELNGSWGGAHVGLLLSPSGGSIEYDCAHGTLDAAVIPDAGGAFRVAGRHVREHGGPERAGEQPPSLPALYEGSVAGNRMQLRVHVGADTLGPFTLQRDAGAQVFKCL
ncbi:MAG TPA: hypothetical protein VHF02_02425 [Luteimonas sp.]|nr:hypothetical protein [Luteimonas sp.]